MAASHPLATSLSIFSMEEIQHSHVRVRGVKLHVAEIGNGPKVVVFLHGFPGIWYSWRHQMVAVAKAGYRAIAIDFRGYGLSDHSPEPAKTTFNDLADDVVALLDSLSISKVALFKLNNFSNLNINLIQTKTYIVCDQAVLVGKNFGVVPAHMLGAACPEKVAGIITMGIPFLLPGPSVLQIIKDLPKGFYGVRWKEPGRAEADFGRFDVKTVMRKIFILFSGSEMPVADDDQEIMDLVDPSTPLPPWFSEEDLSVYADLFENSGFRTALQVPYRAFGIDCGITDPKITSPVLLILGEKDYVLKFPGIEDFIRSDQLKDFIPNMEMKFMAEGNHFVQEQLPEQVNQLIINFLHKISI
ncbi:hypothetical protein LWI29_038258 [Acer saccharum]|uniref:AB hydrolase-1 domain-containing protein n=1 Tax=Acer saccharum TaxID=4024 RepID=A0AA39VM75_ACESA|nr:hypothetical protein LWI29_038258 [Acer saccharum]